MVKVRLVRINPIKTNTLLKTWNVPKFTGKVQEMLLKKYQRINGTLRSGRYGMEEFNPKQKKWIRGMTLKTN